MANSYKTTTCFAKLAQALRRSKKVILQGGQGSGKTTSILQYMIFTALSPKTDLVLSVVGDTLPNLKANPLRIFEKLLKDMRIENQFDVNRTDRTWTHKKTGNIIEFFSVDTDSSRLGARRHFLYVSEATEIKFETYLALAGRSRVVVIDYNPKIEFWVHTELIGSDGYEFLIVTSEDNEYLPANEREILQWYKKKAYFDPDIKDEKLLNASANIKSKYYLNKWRVFGLGLLGVAEGLIFTENEDWEVIERLPKESKYIGAGLDFGFSHVSAIVKLYSWNEKIILREALFKSGMTVSMLSSFIKKDMELMSSVIAADESRPEMIEELFSHGIPIDAAPKGAGSVNLGLDIMHDHDILITADSENMLREFRSYAYATDRNGRSLGVPDKSKDVDNSIDAARYGFRYFLSFSRNVNFGLKKVI